MIKYIKHINPELAIFTSEHTEQIAKELSNQDYLKTLSDEYFQSSKELYFLQYMIQNHVIIFVTPNQQIITTLVQASKMTDLLINMQNQISNIVSNIEDADQLLAIAESLIALHSETANTTETNNENLQLQFDMQEMVIHNFLTEIIDMRIDELDEMNAGSQPAFDNLYRLRDTLNTNFANYGCMIPSEGMAPFEFAEMGEELINTIAQSLGLELKSKEEREEEKEKEPMLLSREYTISENNNTLIKKKPAKTISGKHYAYTGTLSNIMNAIEIFHVTGTISKSCSGSYYLVSDKLPENITEFLSLAHSGNDALLYEKLQYPEVIGRVEKGRFTKKGK